jgi:hypothetical protein
MVVAVVCLRSILASPLGCVLAVQLFGVSICRIASCGGGLCSLSRSLRRGISTRFLRFRGRNIGTARWTRLLLHCTRLSKARFMKGLGANGKPLAIDFVAANNTRSSDFVQLSIRRTLEAIHTGH